MPKYYSLMLSPHISKTPEGYLICREVPICRSGYQEYRGQELERFPGFQESWGLDPAALYKVLRPKDEVLNPDTIASFNGKTVVNEHPEGDAVHVDNEADFNCGHIQDIRVGPELPPSDTLPDGAVTLMGDLVIKDPELIEKIWPEGDPDSGVRDISCGYSLRLKRLADGTLVMTHIRGNHVAVVEKGRAGDLIAIKDGTAPALEVQAKVKLLAAIGDSAPPQPEVKRRTPIMSIRDLLLGRGVKSIMPDASAEEVNTVLKDLEKNSSDGKTSAKDSLSKQDEIAAEHPHRLAAHAALDRCLDARGAADHMGKDAFGKPTHLDALLKELQVYLQEQQSGEGEGEKPAAEEKQAEKSVPAEGEGEGEEEEEEAPPEVEEIKPEEEDEDEDEDEPEKEETDAEPGEVEEEEKEEKPANDADEIDDVGKSVLHAAEHAADSVRSYLKVSKPIVAAIAATPAKKRTKAQQVMLDSYNSAVRGINGAGKNAYKALVKAKVPARIPGLAADAAKAAEDARNEAEKIAGFYEGVPYAKGREKHELYLKEKAAAAK